MLLKPHSSGSSGSPSRGSALIRAVFCACKFSVARKITRKPKTMGHRILSAVSATNCSESFCFYYRPWWTRGLFVVEPLVRNANSSPPVSLGKASFTARTSPHKPSLCGWAPAPGLDEGLGGTPRGRDTTVPCTVQTTQTTCSKGTVLPELGLWSTSGPPNGRSRGQVSVGTLG